MVNRRHLLIWAAGAMLLASATLARAQEDPADVPYTGPAGIPGTPATPAETLGGQTITFQEVVTELTVTPQNVYGGSETFSSTIPGDVILLADPAGGDAPSNWFAVAQFFNPSDPTGAQGLLATEQEGFFARDFANGFTNFSLLPNVYYVANPGEGASGTYMVATATYQQFGPVGAVPGGQTAITILTVSGNVPEPGAAGIVTLGAAVLIVAARCRRRAPTR